MNLTFTTPKTALLLATTLSALSINAIAETYTVTVEMNSSIGETPLVATQTQAMAYPVLEVNEATQEGANCLVVDKVNDTGFDGLPAKNTNSLCPGEIGQSGRVEWTGTPGAILSIEFSIDPQEQNGVRFTGWDGEPDHQVITRTLSSNEGVASFGLWSSIELFDKSQVTDAVMEFTYDISASYQ